MLLRKSIKQRMKRRENEYSGIDGKCNEQEIVKEKGSNENRIDNQNTEEKQLTKFIQGVFGENPVMWCCVVILMIVLRTDVEWMCSLWFFSVVSSFLCVWCLPSCFQSIPVQICTSQQPFLFLLVSLSNSSFIFQSIRIPEACLSSWSS